jgi:hypothetical protein
MAAPSTAPHHAPACPVCGHAPLSPYRGRPSGICLSCHSKERTRLTWLILEEMKVWGADGPVYHFAPEAGLAQRLKQRFPGYRAFDFEPEVYSIEGVPVGKFDLCRDVAGIPSNSIRGIIHHHVLEHVPCNVYYVLEEINRTLVPGGFHLFSIPYFSDYYREDLDLSMTKEDRLRIFGQDDHVRSFGYQDTEEPLRRAFRGCRELSFAHSLPGETLVRFGIPSFSLRRASGHQVRVFVKDA